MLRFSVVVLMLCYVIHASNITEDATNANMGKQCTKHGQVYKESTAYVMTAILANGETKNNTAKPLTCYDYKNALYDVSKFGGDEVILERPGVSYKYIKEHKKACYCNEEGHVYRRVAIGGNNKSNKHKCVNIKDCVDIIEKCQQGAKFAQPRMFMIQSKPKDAHINFDNKPMMITCDVIALFGFDPNEVTHGIHTRNNVTYTVTNHTNVVDGVCLCPDGKVFDNGKCVSISACKARYYRCAAPRVMRTASAQIQDGCPENNDTNTENAVPDTIISCHCPHNTPYWKEGKCITLKQCFEKPKDRHFANVLQIVIAVVAFLVFIGAISLRVMLDKKRQREEADKKRLLTAASRLSETASAGTESARVVQGVQKNKSVECVKYVHHEKHVKSAESEILVEKV